MKDGALCDESRQSATLGTVRRGRSSVVERQPSKLNVEGSSPFARFRAEPWHVAPGPRVMALGLGGRLGEFGLGLCHPAPPNAPERGWSAPTGAPLLKQASTT
jgi:hypothetical protein